MSATTTTLLQPSLPPTRNHLDSQQRTRLIRSTRKLGAVLGTTPQLVEPESFLFLERTDEDVALKRVKSLRRNASVFARPPPQSDFYASSSNNSSSASLVLPPPRSSVDILPTPKSFSNRPRRSADTPRPLILRLNTVPVASSDPRIPSGTHAFANPALSPLTPVNIPTPVTPVFPTPAEVRRKKMAKLTRTLGENVPAELVFSETHSSPNAKLSMHIQRKRSISFDYSDDPDLPPSFSRSSRVWVTGSSSWRGEWNRKDIKEVQMQLRNLKRS